MTFDLAAWKHRIVGALVGLGAGTVVAYLLIAPAVGGGLRALILPKTLEAIPGRAYVPPVVLSPAKWKVAQRPESAKPVPILEPTTKAEATKLEKKLELEPGAIGSSFDLLASGKLPDGRQLFALAPRNGDPVKLEVYTPRFHFGGKLTLEGQAMLDFHGKVQAGHAALLADLVRVGRLQISAGPAALYTPGGSSVAVLVRGSFCLNGC